MPAGIRISALTSLAQVSTSDYMIVNSDVGGTEFTYKAQLGQVAPVRSVGGQTGDVNFPLTADYVSYLNVEGSVNGSSLQTFIDSQPIYVQTWMTTADGIDLAPAVQRLKTAGLLTNGAQIRLPAGNWTASDGVDGGSYFLTFSSCSGVMVEGAGRGTTIITATTAANIGFVNCVELENSTFRGFKFDANRPNQTSTAGIHGLRGNGMTNVVFEDVEIAQSIFYGFGAQSGTFTNVRFNRCKFDRPGSDGMDFKNPNSANSGCTVNEVEVIDWSRRDPSVGKAAIDVRGLVEVTNCIARWTDVSASASAPGPIATNHVGFRTRPDASGALSYLNVSPAVPEEGELVASVSSGATARVRAVSGSSSLTRGGIGLEDVVGTFVPGNLVTFGANTATIDTYTSSADNGGGGSTFTNCVVLGPATTVMGTGFALLDEGSRVIGGSVRNQKTGITIQSGGSRAMILGTEIVDSEVGVDARVANARIYGARITRATDAGIDIIGVTDTVIDGVTFVSCARGVRRTSGSYEARLSNLTFVGTSVRTSNFDWGDQASTFPRTSERGGTVYSILPTASYPANVTVSGGAGGAANSRIYFCPLPIFRQTTILRLGTVIGTAAAGVSAKMALYRDVAGAPTSTTALMAPTSTLDMGSTANTQVRAMVSVGVTVEPGLYWLGYMASGNAAPYTVPVSGAAGEWVRWVGVNNATALLAGSGAQSRVASVSLFDYDLGLPTLCPEVTFDTGLPGSPFLFAAQG